VFGFRVGVRVCAKIVVIFFYSKGEVTNLKIKNKYFLIQIFFQKKKKGKINREKQEIYI
jgi:hypothetical protein